MSDEAIIELDESTSGTVSFTYCARQSGGRQGPEGRRLRPVGFRQVDDDPLHQPAGGAPARPASSSMASNSHRM